MAKNEYLVLKGIDYPPNKRVEVGDIVTDLPKDAIAWLLEDEAISADVPAVPVDAPIEVV